MDHYRLSLRARLHALFTGSPHYRTRAQRGHLAFIQRLSAPERSVEYSIGPAARLRHIDHQREMVAAQVYMYDIRTDGSDLVVLPPRLRYRIMRDTPFLNYTWRLVLHDRSGRVLNDNVHAGDWVVIERSWWRGIHAVRILHQKKVGHTEELMWRKLEWVFV